MKLGEITMAPAEAILVGASLLLLLGYHLILIDRVRRKPETTASGLASRARRIWVETVMEQKLDILAVQTLRNFTMAASLLASTAILLSLGMLNLAFRADDFIHVTHAFVVVGSGGTTLWFVKWFLGAVTFFLAFFNFTLAIRHVNHVSFMINVPPGKDPDVTPGHVAWVLNRGALHYTFGMRGLYLSVPFVLWLFDPVWMLLGSALLILLLTQIDRVP